MVGTLAWSHHSPLKRRSLPYTQGLLRTKSLRVAMTQVSDNNDFAGGTDSEDFSAGRTRDTFSGKNSFAAKARSAPDRYSQTVPKPLGAVSITLWPLSERSFPSAASTE
jgi:hypothetical protein